MIFSNTKLIYLFHFECKIIVYNKLNYIYIFIYYESSTTNISKCFNLKRDFPPVNSNSSFLELP